MELATFAQEWDSAYARGIDAASAYVGDELRRLAQASGPVLCPVLACIWDAPKNMAIEFLRRGADEQGNPVPRMADVWLRLVDGAVPPNTSQVTNAPLPVDQQGKVFVAKVNTLGGTAQAQSFDPRRMVDRKHDGSQMAQRHNRRLPTAHGVTIHKSQCVRVTMDQAIAVLRNWGVGVNARASAKARLDKANRGNVPQQFWLVEDVPEELARQVIPPQPTKQSRQQSANG